MRQRLSPRTTATVLISGTTAKEGEDAWVGGGAAAGASATLTGAGLASAGLAACSGATAGLAAPSTLAVSAGFSEAGGGEAGRGGVSAPMSRVTGCVGECLGAIPACAVTTAGGADGFAATSMV